MKKKQQEKKSQVPVTKSTGSKGGKQSVSYWYFLGGILILALGVYSNSLHNAILTFDDNEYFQNYPEITSLSWESVKKYFSHYYVIMYQPLPVLTFALNYHFSGLNTMPMHLVNLLFHLLNIVLVFYWIKQLTANTNISLIISLLFAIHPMNVEAVSWISARSSSMYSSFYLLALIFYTVYLKTNDVKNILLCGLMFILSLFTKAQAVTLPIVLFLLDYLYNRKLISRKVILEKIPFFILSIIFGLVTVMNEDTMRNITKGMMISYNPVDMFFMVCYSFSFYLIKLFLPLNLCAIYVYPPKNGIWLPWEYYASLILILAEGYLLWKARNNKMIIFCVGFFMVTIAINIQIIPSRLFIVTDRYAYLPYLGLFLLVCQMFLKFKEKSLFQFNKYLPYGIGAIVVFTAFSVFAIPVRNEVWNNDISFLSDVISKNPPVGYIYRAYGNRGFAYKKEGKLQEALNDFNEAIRLDPKDGRNYLNRGLVFTGMQNNKAALEDFNKAISLNPDQPMLYNTRSQVRFLLNDPEGAEADSKKCLELDSLNIDALNTLANISFNRKEYDQCEQYLTRAITIQPSFALGFKNRGLLYMQLNRTADACSDFVQASNLGNADAKQLRSQYCK